MDIIAASEKLVVANMPTGFGKSSTALSVARMVAEETGGKTSILVHRKFLQAQYLDYNLSDPVTALATGRANWPCVLKGYEDKMADRAPCTDGYKCDHKKYGDCPYYAQRDFADYNQVRVLNYPLFLESARLGGSIIDPDDEDADDERAISTFNGFRGNEYIFCDEGHKVAEQILNVVSTSITYADMELIFSLGFQLPKVINLSLKYNPHILEWATKLRAVIGAEVGRLTSDPFYKPGSDKKDRKELLKKLDRKLGKILLLKDTAAAVQFEDSGVLKFRPVLSEQWAHPLLLTHARKTVLMSATIFGAEYWANRMGVDVDQVKYIEVPSTFPKENRPIFFSPVARVNYQIWQNPEEQKKLMDNIDRIIEGYLPHKGIIHTANKRLAMYIRDHSRFNSMMHVGGAEVIEAFKASDMGVLVSYSATEGVDLPDDLCRYVIFAKVPWLPKDDPVIQLQTAEIDGFYEYEAASEIVQGVGRGMRHADDWCVSFILDSSFRMLKSKTWKLLPQWFKEALVEVPVPPLPAQIGV